MLFGLFHGIPLLDYIALRPDHHRRANRRLHFLAVHHLFAEGVVFLHHLGSRIGQQNVGQIVFLSEVIVRWNAVFAHSQQDGIQFLELAIALAEPASLLGSARGAVFRIEKHHDGFAVVVCQRMVFTVAAFQAKRRRFFALYACHS